MDIILTYGLDFIGLVVVAVAGVGGIIYAITEAIKAWRHIKVL